MQAARYSKGDPHRPDASGEAFGLARSVRELLPEWYRRFPFGIVAGLRGEQRRHVRFTSIILLGLLIQLSTYSFMVLTR